MDLLLDPNVAYMILVVGFVLGVLALFTPGTGFLEVGVLLAISLPCANLKNGYTWSLQSSQL